MKKILKNTFAFLSCCLVLLSCSEDFLEKDPLARESDVSFYSTISGALQGLTAAYEVNQYGEAVQRQEFWGTVCSGDALASGEPGGGDQPAMQMIMRFETTPGNDYCANLYSSYFLGIFRANLVIDRVPDIKTTQESPAGYNIGKRIVAEAKFLRAIYYFKLVTTFGAVPVFDHSPTPEELDCPRPPIGDVWLLIEKDLTEAIPDLPLKSEYADEDMGRVTKGAAQGLLVKALLFMGSYKENMPSSFAYDSENQINAAEKYEKAFSVAQDVIGSNQYKLIGGEGDTKQYTHDGLKINPYRWIWKPEGENCDESVFEIQHEDTPGSAPHGAEGCFIARYYNIRQYIQWNGEKWDNSLAYTGWGFISPTDYFVKTAFKDFDSKGKPIDPRYEYSVMEEDDKVEIAGGDSAYANLWVNYPTGRGTWKYQMDPDNAARNITNMTSYNNRWLRYADVLLLGAEAAVRTGNKTKAIEWINQVRTRARLIGNSSVPANLSDVTLEDVIAERRIELAFEGHRFFDMVRTGSVKKVLDEAAANYGSGLLKVWNTAAEKNPNATPKDFWIVAEGETAIQQYGTNFVQGKNEILPIPQREVDISLGKIAQNPGY